MKPLNNVRIIALTYPKKFISSSWFATFQASLILKKWRDLILNTQ